MLLSSSASQLTERVPLRKRVLQISLIRKEIQWSSKRKCLLVVYISILVLLLVLKMKLLTLLAFCLYALSFNFPEKRGKTTCTRLREYCDEDLKELYTQFSCSGNQTGTDMLNKMTFSILSMFLGGKNGECVLRKRSPDCLNAAYNLSSQIHRHCPHGQDSLSSEVHDSCPKVKCDTDDRSSDTQDNHLYFDICSKVGDTTFLGTQSSEISNDYPKLEDISSSETNNGYLNLSNCPKVGVDDSTPKTKIAHLISNSSPINEDDLSSKANDNYMRHPDSCKTKHNSLSLIRNTDVALTSKTVQLVGNHRLIQRLIDHSKLIHLKMDVLSKAEKCHIRLVRDSVMDSGRFLNRPQRGVTDNCKTNGKILKFLMEPVNTFITENETFTRWFPRKQRMSSFSQESLDLPKILENGRFWFSKNTITRQRRNWKVKDTIRANGIHENDILQSVADIPSLCFMPDNKEILHVYHCERLSGRRQQPQRLLETEGARLASFESTLAPPGVWLIRLAAEGFYCSDNGGLLKCTYCPVEVDITRLVFTDPKELHRRLSPGCPFVKGLAVNTSLEQRGFDAGLRFINEIESKFADQSRKDLTHEEHKKNSEIKIGRSLPQCSGANSCDRHRRSETNSFSDPPSLPLPQSSRKQLLTVYQNPLATDSWEALRSVLDGNIRKDSMAVFTVTESSGLQHPVAVSRHSELGFKTEPSSDSSGPQRFETHRLVSLSPPVVSGLLPMASLQMSATTAPPRSTLRAPYSGFTDPRSFQNHGLASYPPQPSEFVGRWSNTMESSLSHSHAVSGNVSTSLPRQDQNSPVVYAHSPKGNIENSPSPMNVYSINEIRPEDSEGPQSTPINQTQSEDPAIPSTASVVGPTQPEDLSTPLSSSYINQTQSEDLIVPQDTQIITHTRLEESAVRPSTSGVNQDSVANSRSSTQTSELVPPSQLSGASQSTEETLGELGIYTQEPRRPDFAVPSTRLPTFADWPHNDTHSPEEMAEAGFYFVGQHDLVRCFYCKGGLKTWSRMLRPWIEHARFYPQCPFVGQVKGKEFVETVLALSKRQKMISNADVEREMRGRRTLSSDREKQGNGRDEDPEDWTEEDLEGSEDLTTEGDQADLYVEQLRRTAAALENENEDLRNERLCKICQTHDVTILCLPCGHLLSCAHCAPALRACAICRRRVGGRVRISNDASELSGDECGAHRPQLDLALSVE